MGGRIAATRAWRFFWWLTGRPRAVVALGLTLLIAALAFVPRITRDTTIEAFIAPDDPVLATRERVREVFGLGDPMVIAVRRDAEGGIFHPHTLALIQWLAQQLQELPGLNPDRVFSIATEKNITGRGDELVVERFYETPPSTPAGADAVREAVLAVELLAGSLVSRDGRMTLVVAELEDGSRELALHEALSELVARAPVADEVLSLAGPATMNATLGWHLIRDSRRMIPVAGAVVVAVLLLSYRTPRGFLLPFLVMVTGCAVPLGAMAATGVPMYIVTVAIWPILIGVSVADGIHILGEYYEQLARRPDDSQRELVVRSMVAMGRPVIVTSVTDVAGFLAIWATATAPPLGSFGLFAALGVGAALGMSLFVVPAALVLLPPRPAPAYRPAASVGGEPIVDAYGRAASALGRQVLSRPRWIAAAAGGIVVLGVIGAFRMEIGGRGMLGYFGPGDPVLVATAAIDREMNGAHQFDVLVEAGDSEGIARPETLRAVERLQEFLEKLPHVTASESVVDLLKRMNRALHENRPEAYALPERADLVAQYLLLYSMSSDSSDLGRWIDGSHRRANVRVTLDSAYYGDNSAVIDAARRYLATQFDRPGLDATLTGSANLIVHWLRGVAASHFRSMALALVAVWITMVLCFRSLAAGTLTLVPVSMAMLLIYAVMGFGGVWLNTGTAMIAAITLGTGLDFAIHTLDRLVAQVREQGRNLEQALEELYPSTGRALIFNFSALFLGFGSVVVSGTPTIQTFGLLIATASAASFGFSLTVIPALLLLLRPRFLAARGAEPHRP